MKSKSFYQLYDAEDYENFIKATIKIFRLSNEYKMWLSTTNNEECALTGKSKDSIDIEVHHYGKTLWEIVEQIVNYFIQENLPLNSFYICLILIDIHLNNGVSYIPVEHCIHKMLHKDPLLAKNLYPDIESKVTHGNETVKISIILNWINFLKQSIL
jgi:hypothetical protein